MKQAEVKSATPKQPTKSGIRTMGGYGLLFFKHIIRSLLLAAIVLVIVDFVSLLLAVLLDLVFNDLFGLFKVLTVRGILILGSIIGFVVSLCAMAIANKCFGNDGRVFGRMQNGPHIVGLRLELFLVFLLLAGGSVGFVWFKWDWLTELYTVNDWYILIPLSLVVLAIFELLYYWIGRGAYKQDQCPKCKHVFCYGEHRTGTKDEYDTYGYTDTTKNETIAKIGSVDVRADVTRRQYTRTHHTIAEYHAHCYHCGHDWTSTAHYNHKEKI